jgi:hypothetical protein
MMLICLFFTDSLTGIKQGDQDKRLLTWLDAQPGAG